MKKYHVRMPKENLQELSGLFVKNIKEDEGFLEFLTDEAGLRKISEFPETSFYNRRKKMISNFFKNHIVAFIGLFLIIIALINQNISVRIVKFAEADTYDEEVVNYLEKYYYHVGPFCYLNANLTEINYDLRSTFYHYEWIGIRKNGAVLYVDVKKLVNPLLTEDLTPGSLVAKYEGIIKEYHVTAGTVVIHEEQYVAAGTLLISGEVAHYNDEIELVRAKGYVIGEVLEYRDFVIPKKTTNIIRTGRLEVIKAYKVFGHQINENPSKFESYDVVAGEKCGGKVFSVQTFYRYEIKDITITYTKDEAIAYSKSLVYRDFRKEKTIDKEKILFIELVRVEEDDNNFYIRLIVKSYKNIAMFIPF